MSPLGLACLAVAVASVALIWHRLRMGVDVTDEAFYLAEPYLFAVGGKPFFNEINILQIPGFLLYPVVKAYLALNGGVTGLVLFMRRLYVVFNVAVAGSVFVLLKRWIRWEHALLASCLGVVFIPYNIPNLFYNTMAAGFFTASVCTGAWPLLFHKRWPLMSAAGALQACAAIAYPPLVVVLPYYALTVWLLGARAERSRLIAAFCGGAALTFLPVAAVLWSAGPHAVAGSVAYTAGIGVNGGGWPKVAMLVREMATLVRGRPVMLAAVVVALLARRRAAWLSAASLMLMPVAALVATMYAPPEPFEATVLYTAVWALLAFELYPFVERETWARQAMMAIALPGAVAGVTMAYNSSSHFLNFPVAGFPLALAACVFFAEALTVSLRARSDTRRWHPWAVALALAVLLAVNVQADLTALYRDGPAPALTADMTSGPWKGIRTTEARRHHLVDLSLALERYARPGDSVFFYEDFPAGYLLTTLRPWTNTMWNFSPLQYPAMYGGSTVDFFERTATLPDLVARNESLRYSANDPLDRWVRERYTPVLRHEKFTLYRRE